MREQLRRAIEVNSEQVLAIRSQHLEMLAAAFLRATDLPPEECVLVEQWHGPVIRWWFERKGTR